jgi:beta-phosphoglucomutase
MNPDHNIPPPSRPARAEARPKVVLFDFDGVLADTENHHVAAWQRTFALLGWTVDDASCLPALEADDRIFLQEVFARRKLQGDVSGWVERKQELTLQLLRDSPRVYAGVSHLVARLSGRAELGVVTTTCRANVEAMLTSAGLSDVFRTIVSQEDVRVTKPDPEGYRLALKRFGVVPTEAVALEDSPTGLAAARAAGVRALAIGHRRLRGDWVGEATYVSDLRDIDTVLSLLGFASQA